LVKDEEHRGLHRYVHDTSPWWPTREE